MKYNFKAETPTAKLPTKHTRYSAGIDFYSDETSYIPKGESRNISTGISWNPDTFVSEIGEYKDICLIIQSRSGLAFKRSLEASNAGVIDQDYVSTKDNKAIINVKMYNNGDRNLRIDIGDKICQGIPQFIPHFTDVEILDNNRNGLGFGSSDGKNNKS